MAINLKNHEHRSRLARAIRRSYDLSAPDRSRRADLIRIYADRSTLTNMFLNDRDNEIDRTAYLNLFALFVRGHEISLAYRAPKWSINARTAAAKGFDKRIQIFLDKYADILGLSSLAHTWAIDSAFGRAVAKVVTSIAPKGIVSPVAPRTFRLNPDHVILDRSASTVAESTYFADMYFADLDEAREHPYFDEAGRASLTEWSAGNGSGSNSFPYPGGDHELFASAQTRLVDVYIPARGVLATWACPNDTFDYISTSPPLQELTVPNPYVILDLLTTPDSLDIVSRLGQLRPLNMLANDMFEKGAQQAYNSQRNPIAQQGNDQDAHAITNAPDGEVALLSDMKAVDVFNIPGPDPSIFNLANSAAGLFSQHAGNLNTALGISPGASTARQTQAMISQITEAQAVDRMKFEEFLGEIGKRLGTLAFHDEMLQLDAQMQIPGTKIWLNVGWGPPDVLPRVGSVDDYKFEVVPFSTAFRGPQERLAQLDAATKLVAGLMQLQAAGAPLDLQTILEDAAEAFDLVPNLQAWWSGQPPTPQQSAQQTYQTMAGQPQGTSVQYQGSGGNTEQSPQGSMEPAPAGLASAGM